MGRGQQKSGLLQKVTQIGGVTLLSFLLSACHMTSGPNNKNSADTSRFPFFPASKKVVNPSPLVSGLTGFEFSLSFSARIDDWQVGFSHVYVDLVNRRMRLIGVAQKTIEENGFVSIGAGQSHDCEFSAELSSADLETLEAALSSVRSCQPDDSSQVCPTIGILDPLAAADLILVKPAEKIHLSTDPCLIALDQRIQTLCAKEQDLEDFFTQRISTSQVKECLPRP